jgi:hypothetical protein
MTAVPSPGEFFDLFEFRGAPEGVTKNAKRWFEARRRPAEVIDFK